MGPFYVIMQIKFATVFNVIVTVLALGSFSISSLKICNKFSVKKILSLLIAKSGLDIQVFVGSACNACYVSETTRHLSTRVREHVLSDRASHSFKEARNGF